MSLAPQADARRSLLDCLECILDLCVCLCRDQCQLAPSSCVGEEGKRAASFPGGERATDLVQPALRTERRVVVVVRVPVHLVRGSQATARRECQGGATTRSSRGARDGNYNQVSDWNGSAISLVVTLSHSTR